MTIRFVLRGTALLRALREPQEAKRLLGLIYEWRSKIVHSGKSLTDPEAEDQFKKWALHPFLSPPDGGTYAGDPE